jgi:hypothetical protein
MAAERSEAATREYGVEFWEKTGRKCARRTHQKKEKPPIYGGFGSG